MNNTREAIRVRRNHENARGFLKWKILIAVAVLGIALQSAAPVYSSTIFERDKFLKRPTVSATNTPPRKDQTPLPPTPTPIYKLPPNVNSCTYIPLGQESRISRPTNDGMQVTGSKTTVIVIIKPEEGIKLYSPGQLLPGKIDPKSQIYSCTEQLFYIPPALSPSPTPPR